MADVAGQVVSLKVVVRARDLDSFIDRYSHYISGDRIFIFTKSAQKPGAQVRFLMLLVSGEPLIHGEGTVTRVRADTGDPKKPPGMEVRFKALDDRSQTLVDFLLATRAGAVSEAPAEPVTEVGAPPSPEPTDLPSAQTFMGAPPVAPVAPVASLFPPPRPLPPLRPALRRAVPPPATPLQAEPPPVPPQEPPSEAPPQMEALAPPLPAATSALEALAAAAGERPAPAPVPEPAPGVLAAAPSPPPTFAEVFRPLDGTPEGMVPANPFSEVSEGAIEYFVEWSLEQSVGPKRDDSASFSNVPMALPGQTGKIAAYDPDGGLAWPPRRQMAMLLGIGLAVGLPLGAGLMWVLRTPAPAQVAPAVAAAAAPAKEPTPAPADEPAAAPGDEPVPAPSPRPAAASRPSAAAAARPAAADGARVALAITSRPPGANVIIDGKSAGLTPVTVQVEPGARDVRLVKERYAQVTSTVEAPGSLDIALKRPLATLNVTSSAPNASVTVQGVPRGTAPVRVQLPAYESYRVEVQARGLPPWKRIVYVKTPSTSAAAVISAPATPKRR